MPQDATSTEPPVPELDPDHFVSDWLSLAEVGDRLGLGSNRVKQLIRERHLLAFRRKPGTGPVVPSAFLDGSRVLKGLHGTLVLLHDAGYDDLESLRWLFTTEDALEATPMRALAEQRSKAVHRIAQGLGF